MGMRERGPLNVVDHVQHLHFFDCNTGGARLG
jgi:hypothetical protein